MKKINFPCTYQPHTNCRYIDSYGMTQVRSCTECELYVSDKGVRNSPGCFGVILALILLSITLVSTEQVKTKHPESLAAMTVLAGTATATHFVDRPDKAKVAATGMATTAITYFTVKAIRKHSHGKLRHRIKRNRVYKRV